MKIPALFKKKTKERIVTDFYQLSIEKVGKAQLKRIVEKGLNVPVVVL